MRAAAMAVVDASDRLAAGRAGMASTRGSGSSSGNRSFSSICFCSSSMASAQLDLPETKRNSMNGCAI
eukprot:11452125-Karenia_brevis.AAC.1